MSAPSRCKLNNRGAETLRLRGNSLRNLGVTASLR